jgi:hypothetical protein
LQTGEYGSQLPTTCLPQSDYSFQGFFVHPSNYFVDNRRGFFVDRVDMLFSCVFSSSKHTISLNWALMGSRSISGELARLVSD